MSVRKIVTAMTVISVGLVLSQGVFAQSTHGTITGTVVDSSKAVVPGVSITVTNVGTNNTRVVFSSSEGNYEAANLSPGTYRLKAELPGFKTFLREGIILQSRAAVRVDVALEVGEQTTEIHVTAATPVIETEGPQIADVRDARQLEELPSVTSGEALAYILTSPGVQSASIFTYSFNGSRTAQSEYTIDGITSPRSFATPLVGTQNSFEMVSELKVYAANNSAEFSSPGVISVVTKAGTNALHGTLFYFHNNSALNARNFFDATKRKNKTHNFGFALGGPVYIPKLYSGKDRTFFMLSYWTARIPGVNEANVNVPSLPMRRGDFSALAGNITDPETGKPFPGKTIPDSRLDRIALRIQERFFPLPNFGNPNVLTSNNHRSLVERENLTHRVEARIDQKISDSNLLYLRYAWRGGPQQPLENLPTIGVRDGYRRGSSFVVSDTHSFKAWLVNEFRFGFQRSPNQVLGPLNGQEVLRFTGVQGVTGGEGLRGMPRFNVTGFTSISSINNTDDVNQVFEGTDILTWTHATHTLKSGIDFQRTQANGIDLPPEFFGQFAFSGFFTGNAYADFLLGLPERSTRATYRGATYLRGTQLNLFVSDDWKISPKVTLNLGARYEYEFAPIDKDGFMYNLDPRTFSLVVPDRMLQSGKINPLLPAAVKVISASQAGFPQTLLRPDKNNIVPRIGLAVRPRDKMVIRAGYGIFNDSLGIAMTPPNRGAGAPLFGFTEEFRNTNRQKPAFRFPNPFGTAGSIGTIVAEGIRMDFRNPYVQQWNLTLEREMPADIGIRASYIGTKATHLGFRRDLNVPPPSTTAFSNSRRPFPALGRVLFSDNGGSSIYHGLQLDAERRFARGLFFQAAWTYSNLLSDVPDERNDLGPVIENPLDRRRERGREAYSVRHRVTGAFIYELPVGRGRRFWADRAGAFNHILGGWTASSLLYFETGRYFTPAFSGVDVSGTGATGGRPDRVRNGNLPADQRAVAGWFDTAAFVVPPRNSGRFGTAGRNILEGPGLNVVHFSLLKRFFFGERSNVQLQLNILNLFNHPNFEPPAANISAASAVGKITRMRDRQEHQDGSRSMSVELRINF